MLSYLGDAHAPAPVPPRPCIYVGKAGANMLRGTGGAVGPASLTILMETAYSIAIGEGAVGGLILGLMG